jgi:Ca2+:H+ antiporter
MVNPIAGMIPRGAGPDGIVAVMRGAAASAGAAITAGAAGTVDIPAIIILAIIIPVTPTPVITILGHPVPLRFPVLAPPAPEATGPHRARQSPRSTGVAMFRALLTALSEEWFLAVSAGTAGIFLAFGAALRNQPAGPAGLSVIFLSLFIVALGASLSVVRHAEHLAVKLGEPYGTLILTLAVTIIEVMSISAMTVHGAHNPALVRDTIFAIIMILLNGMVGISLLIGGWRHWEQQFNLLGANSYLGVIIPITVLSLILPNYTSTTPGPTLSAAQEVFVAAVSLGLYAAFLGVQTVRHRAYFILGESGEASGHDIPHSTQRHPTVHALLLVAYMVPLVFLAEQLAGPVDTLLQVMNAPPALGGAVIALLVATPEALSAVRAAAANHLQRSMNIFLGSVLSTISLTIPAMILLSQFTGDKIVLGLQNGNSVMLVLSLVVSLVTFSSGRTNVLQGAIHLVLFGAAILLMFQS